MRSALSGLSGLLAALLLPLALVSVWLHTVVADTGEYLARVDPLAAEQRVREAVEDVLVEGLLQRVDLTALGERLQATVDATGLDLPFDVPELPGDLDDRLARLGTTSARCSSGRVGTRPSPPRSSYDGSCARSWRATPSPPCGGPPSRPGTARWSRC